MPNNVFEFNGAIYELDINGNRMHSALQVSTLPDPQSVAIGTVYQYIGPSTSSYISGYFYKNELVQYSEEIFNDTAIYDFIFTNNKPFELDVTMQFTFPAGYTDTAYVYIYDDQNDLVSTLEFNSTHTVETTTIYPGYKIDSKVLVFGITRTFTAESTENGYVWNQVRVSGDINDNSVSLNTTYSSSKIEEIVPKIWTGTTAEYEAVKTSIPAGTLIAFTDDYSVNLS